VNYSVLLVLGSCASLQFGAATAVGLFDDLGTWGVTLLRLAIGGVLLFAVSRPAVHRWTKGQWRSVVCFAVAMALMNGFYYAAIDLIPLSAAVALEFTGPLVYSALTSRRRGDLVWVGCAAAGMVVLGAEAVVGGDGLDPLGVIYALVAGMFWVGYIIFSGQVGQKIPGTGGLAVAMVLGAVVLTPVGASGAAGIIDHPDLILFAVLTSLLASVLPYTLELAALRRLPGSVFSVLVSLEPAFAAAAGFVLLGQQLTGWRAVTIVLVICASAGITWSQNHQRAKLRRLEPAALPEVQVRDVASEAASAPKIISAVTSPRESSGHSAR
jgi:inner membrane transporter RhtA